MTINREHFEAWLFSQPKDKVFFYNKSARFDYPNGCLICNYLVENVARPHKWVGLSDFTMELPEEMIDFPSWLQKLLPPMKGHNIIFTANDIQLRYLSLFPDPQAVSCGDGNETLPSKKQTESQTTNS